MMCRSSIGPSPVVGYLHHNYFQPACKALGLGGVPGAIKA
jgi:hypothetical protein